TLFAARPFPKPRRSVAQLDNRGANASLIPKTSQSRGSLQLPAPEGPEDASPSGAIGGIWFVVGQRHGERLNQPMQKSCVTCCCRPLRRTGTTPIFLGQARRGNALSFEREGRTCAVGAP